MEEIDRFENVKSNTAEFENNILEPKVIQRNIKGSMIDQLSSGSKSNNIRDENSSHISPFKDHEKLVN